MNTKSRITSILNANSLDSSVTGIESFDLSKLDLDRVLEFQIPTNVRLGHLAESIVSESIKASVNYRVLYENIQIIEDKKTIGEIDFILEDIEAKRLIHMELAYKFYLFDPSISSNPLNNWIGPNRNDSLVEKLEKLRSKQFPLLYHDAAKSIFDTLELAEISQVLCLLASLFIPYGYKSGLSPVYEKAIKGYYVNFETFIGFDHSGKVYCIPTKKEWGIDPVENRIWSDFKGIEEKIEACKKERQALLCWQRVGDLYSAFFIVWW